MKILITRPSFYAIDLIKKLHSLGKSAWNMPLIDFLPSHDLINFNKKINALCKGDFLFALSQNAIIFLKNIIFSQKTIWPEYLKYYAIGKTTALKLQEISHRFVNYPKIYPCSENLIKLLNIKKLKGKKALILCGENTRSFLPEFLKNHGTEIIFCKSYKRIKKEYNKVSIGNYWEKIGINTLIVTSMEILNCLYDIFFPKHKKWLFNCKLIVISKRLYTIAKNIGWHDIYISENADNQSLLKFIKKNFFYIKYK